MQVLETSTAVIIVLSSELFSLLNTIMSSRRSNDLYQISTAVFVLEQRQRARRQQNTNVTKTGKVHRRQWKQALSRLG